MNLRYEENRKNSRDATQSKINSKTICKTHADNFMVIEMFHLFEKVWV